MGMEGLSLLLTPLNIIVEEETSKREPTSWGGRPAADLCQGSLLLTRVELWESKTQ